MKGSDVALPAGFRFHPTDEELVNHYLLKKCGGHSISAPIIAEIDLYKFDPWQLPGLAVYGEKEWYFFSPRDRKYPKGSRPNRAAGSGYWKATGADKPIGKPKALGIKKALVFYAGKAPTGVKTNWIMHEYRLANVDRSAANGSRKGSRLDDWVLCRIYNKKGAIEKHAPAKQFEELKPKVMFGQQQMYAETSESGSSWEQVVSPVREKEVQSEAKWSELEQALDFQFNYMDGFPEMATAAYYDLQFGANDDMFMHLHNNTF